jgi:hypothetical protein
LIGITLEHVEIFVYFTDILHTGCSKETAKLATRCIGLRGARCARGVRHDAIVIDVTALNGRRGRLGRTLIAAAGERERRVGCVGTGIVLAGNGDVGTAAGTLSIALEFAVFTSDIDKWAVCGSGAVDNRRLGRSILAFIALAGFKGLTGIIIGTLIIWHTVSVIECPADSAACTTGENATTVTDDSVGAAVGTTNGRGGGSGSRCETGRGSSRA